MAAPMYIVEERTIGPSLGADNIEKGKISVIIGLILVLFFMVYYYRRFWAICKFCVNNKYIANSFYYVSNTWSNINSSGNSWYSFDGWYGC